jgi:hypothetical protein
MAKANIHRRSTLEAVYPPDAFASDAAQNSRVPNTALSGVRILSAPDAGGDFDFERATRQIGEAASASFLTPHRRDEGTQDAGRDGPATKATDPDPRAGYEAFLDDIVAVAQRFGFEPEESPGRNEPRLRGLRQ